MKDCRLLLLRRLHHHYRHSSPNTLNRTITHLHPIATRRFRLSPSMSQLQKKRLHRVHTSPNISQSISHRLHINPNLILLLHRQNGMPQGKKDQVQVCKSHHFLGPLHLTNRVLKRPSSHPSIIPLKKAGEDSVLLMYIPMHQRICGTRFRIQGQFPKNHLSLSFLGRGNKGNARKQQGYFPKTIHRLLNWISHGHLLEQPGKRILVVWKSTSKIS